MHWTEFEGVFFVEETVPNAKFVHHAVVKLHGLFTQAQLKNLNDVKHRLSAMVKAKGANAIINFKYGQKSSFWTTLVGVDNVNWYGEGDIVVLSESDIARIKQRRPAGIQFADESIQITG